MPNHDLVTPFLRVDLSERGDMIQIVASRAVGNALAVALHEFDRGQAPQARSKLVPVLLELRNLLDHKLISNSAPAEVSNGIPPQRLDSLRAQQNADMATQILKDEGKL